MQHAKYKPLYPEIWVNPNETNNDVAYQDFLACQVNTTQDLDPQEIVLSIDGIPLLHRGEMLTIFGPPKSRKSRFTTAVSSASIGNPMLGITAEKKGFKANIYDTEQGQHHFQDQMRVLFDGAGHQEHERARGFALRGFKHFDRALELLERDIMETRPDVVIVDAMADLLTRGVLDAQESTDLIRTWEEWLKKYNFALINVQHSTKSSPNNPRGHFGSESERRSETVISTQINPDNRMITTISAGQTRNQPFDDMFVMVDQFSGRLCRMDLSVLRATWKDDKGKDVEGIPESWDLQPEDFTPEDHSLILDNVFGQYPSLKAEDFRQRLKRLGDGKRRLTSESLSLWIAFYCAPMGGLKKQGEYFIRNDEGAPTLPF